MSTYIYIYIEREEIDISTPFLARFIPFAGPVAVSLRRYS